MCAGLTPALSRPTPVPGRSGEGGKPLLNVVTYVVYLLLIIYGWLIVARAILTWFRVGPRSPVHYVRRVLYTLTEPYLRLLRRIIPVERFGWTAGLDLTPVLGLIILFVVIQVLVRI